jgi:hypothetical protein
VSFFETIRAETSRRHLQFLVIGGMAINLYGYSRETADIDFLVGRDDREKWLKLFSEFEYTVYHDGENFVQLSPPQQNPWPVDLMFVRRETFDPMFLSSREIDLYGISARVPSLEHLLALKLHALKNTRMERFLKDFLDVENLIRINKLDIKSKKVRKLFAKYGTLELYEKVSTTLAS